MSTLYVDHQMLTQIAGNDRKEPAANDLKAFRKAVRDKVFALEEEYRQVIIIHFFEDKSIEMIARETNTSAWQISIRIQEALKILKYSLAEIVRKRWPGRFDNLYLCPICNHPQKKEIEKIITAKKKQDSWGLLNKRLKKKIGLELNPPSIIINHIKYHMKG